MQTENTLMKRHLARKRVRNTTDQSSLGSHCFHIVPIIVDFSANKFPVTIWTRQCSAGSDSVLEARGCYLHGELEDEASEEVKCSSSLLTSPPLALYRCFTPLCPRAAQWLSRGPLHQIMTPRSPPAPRAPVGKVGRGRASRSESCGFISLWTSWGAHKRLGLSFGAGRLLAPRGLPAASA